MERRKARSPTSPIFCAERVLITRNLLSRPDRRPSGEVIGRFFSAGSCG
jgi:hypothetical protein